MTRPRPRGLRAAALPRALAGAVALLAFAASLMGCPRGSGKQQVVVYVALDRLFAQPILDAYTAETGVEVLAKWDTEATKTTGLVQSLRAESARPRCDVFWNNELGQTIELSADGLLAGYRSPSADGLPAWACDPSGRWTGFAARARVLIVNSALVPEAEQPTRLTDLVAPRWEGKCGIAKPLFGTTATHAAALFATLGTEGARSLFEGMKRNKVVLCAGNSDVKDRVAKGELAWGLTDTDDANLAVLEGAPVRIVFPDQEEGGLGTLLIPNAISLVAGAPHPDAGRRFIDYALRRTVEEQLAASRSAQVPLREGLARAPWIPAHIRTMAPTWEAIADAFPTARAYLRDEFLAE